MTTEFEQLGILLGGKTDRIDVEKALKEFYRQTHPVASSARVEALPVILSKTHVTTLVDGVPKAISISDFKGVINAMTSEDEEKVPPISLPYGCFMFNRSGEHLYLNCYYRGTVSELKFNNRDGKKNKYMVPLPHVIISFTLKKVNDSIWQVMLVKYLSTSKSVSQLPDNIFFNKPQGEHGIHKFPFPNMYSDDKMCYGGNTMPVRFTNNLRGLDYYYQIITQAPFNSDLGVNGLTQSFTPEHWFTHLSGMKEFPYDLLSNINYN